MKLINYIGNNYSNYKISKSKIFYPKNKEEILALIKYSNLNNLKILTIGSSVSWYDTVFNTKNIIINLKHYKKIFVLDKKRGVLTISASYKILEVIEKINKSGWTIYSVPGYPHATLGGCVSNDVHGKDSFLYGNFGDSIIEIEIILSNNRLVKCSKTKNQNIFKSAIGGLGLIGIITKIKLKLKKINKSYTTNIYICKNYKELVKEIYYKKQKYNYLYGWIDFYSKKNQLGRGIIFKTKANDSSNSGNLNQKSFITRFKSFLKNIIFNFFTRYNLNKYLNILFFNSFKLQKNEFFSSYREVAWPLDDIDVKKAIYPNSFYEIQFIIKKENLPNALKEFIEKCQSLKINTFITGIKIHKKSKNYLSFAEDGVSINANQIFNKKNEKYETKKFLSLYNYVLKKNYKMYICKDFFFRRKSFNKNYILYKNFIKIKKRFDKKNLFHSDFFKRINQK